MQQIKITETRNLLNKDDQNFKDLIKSFQNIVKLEKALADGYLIFEKQLEKFGDNEINGVIQAVFRDVAKVQKQLTESRKKYIELIENKVIPSINVQINEVKERRITLQDYEKKKNTEETKDRAYRMNNDAMKQNQLHQALEEAKKESSYTASSLSNKMRLYVDEKNAELKAMFQHLINSQLMYHALGLEKLSQLTYQINHMDDSVETKKILELFLGTKDTARQPQKEQEQKQQ